MKALVFITLLTTAVVNSSGLSPEDFCQDYCDKVEPTAQSFCPTSHPLRVDDGRHCCSNLNRKNDQKTDPRCDGDKLLRLDPVICCKNDDYVPCDNQKICKSTVTDVLIMRQDTRVSPHVFDSSTYLSLNPNNPAASLYSQLSNLESFRLSTGKFHLKLCYPLLTDTPNKCYEFKQTSHPLTVTDVNQDVVGLEILQLPYTNLRASDPFVGLRSDSNYYAFLDGDKGSNWFASIGTKAVYPINTNEGIPAAFLADGTQRITPLAELWAVVYN